MADLTAIEERITRLESLLDGTDSRLGRVQETLLERIEMRRHEIDELRATIARSVEDLRSDLEHVKQRRW